MKHSYLLLLVPFALMTSCGPHEISTPVSDVIAGPEVILSDYPMQIGHMWAYDNGDTIQVVGDTTINGYSSRKVVKKNGSYTATAYYANLSDGWHLVAASSISSFNLLIDAAGAVDTSTSLFMPDAPALMARLPVAPGDWQISVPSVANYSRRWEGYFTVKTPAGTFDCVKLSTGLGIEYYSTKGIVQTEHILTCVTAPCPNAKAKLVYVNF